MFVNGRARGTGPHAERGFFQADGEITMDDRAKLRFRDGDILPEWAFRKDVEIIALQSWAEIRMMIREIDPASKTAILSTKVRALEPREGRRYYVENVPVRLTHPVSSSSTAKPACSRICHVPGEDMAKVDMSPRPSGNSSASMAIRRRLPVSPTFVSGHRVRIHRLDAPRKGYVDMQAATTSPALSGERAWRISSF